MILSLGFASFCVPVRQFRLCQVLLGWLTSNKLQSNEAPCAFNIRSSEKPVLYYTAASSTAVDEAALEYTTLHSGFLFQNAACEVFARESKPASQVLEQRAL